MKIRKWPVSGLATRFAYAQPRALGSTLQKFENIRFVYFCDYTHVKQCHMKCTLLLNMARFQPHRTHLLAAHSTFKLTIVIYSVCMYFNVCVCLFFQSARLLCVLSHTLSFFLNSIAKR